MHHHPVTTLWAPPRAGRPARRRAVQRSLFARPCGLRPWAARFPSLARALALGALWLLSGTGGQAPLRAQAFPVTALVQVGQFSPYLEAYDDPGRVVVTLISTDARPTYEVVLRFTLSGPGFSIRSRPDFLPFPVVLRRNQPLVLTGSQLRDYFDPAHLTFAGASLNNILAGGGLLAEGPVSLCVEVFDYQRFFDPPVSNTGCANGLLQLQRPPVLVAPGPAVTASFPQNLRFQWQPQHAGVAVRYTLEVYEDILPGLGDNLVIENTQPLVVARTVAPFYLLTSLDPLLPTGSRYLVRVRAVDLAGQAAFLNDGWSNIASFVYQPAAPPPAACPPPRGLRGLALSPTSLQLAWTPDPTVTAWLLLSPTNDSLPLPASASQYQAGTLAPGQEYLYQLCAVCPDGSLRCEKVAVLLPAAPVSTDTTTTACNADLAVQSQPLTDTSLLVSWSAVPLATGFTLRWGRVADAPAGLAQPTPGGPPRTSPLPVFTDSRQLPAGSTSAAVTNLHAGTSYQWELCATCPAGGQTCTTWTEPFAGPPADCLLALDLVRTDSTATSLTFAWTSDPADLPADATFTLVWQLADATAPADSVRLPSTDGSFTIHDLQPFRTYQLRRCATCTATGPPACRPLGTFGGCRAAYEPYLADLTDAQALLAWQPAAGAPLLPTQARYKPRVATRWDSLTVGQNRYFDLTALDLDTAQVAEAPALRSGITYAAQVQTQCADSTWSDWSAPVLFNRDCAVADDLWLTGLTDTSATIAGLAQANAGYYAFAYRRAGQQEWTTGTNLTLPLLALPNLQPATTYEVRLRYWCSQGVWSDYSPPFAFTTLPPCAPPSAVVVDPFSPAAAQLQWTPSPNARQTELRYRPQSGGYFYPSVYPPLWQSASVPDRLLLLDHLQGGAAYDYQLRSDCAVNQSAWTDVDVFTLPCAPPQTITVSDTTSNSALVQLGGLPPAALGSHLHYQRLGDSTWQTTAAAYGLARLAALDDYTYYALRATATCAGGQTSPYSHTVQFRTPVRCLAPDQLVATDLQPFAARLNWAVTGTITEWEVLLRGPWPILPGAAAAQTPAGALPAAEMPSPPSGNPTSGLPGDPASPPPGNPVSGLPGDPTNPPSGNPASGLPGDPTRPPSDNPASGLPGDPTRPPSGNPVSGLPGDPASPPPGNPASGLPGDPTNPPSGNPANGLPGDPTRPPSGNPASGLPGDPARLTLGDPPGGSLPPSATGAAPNSSVASATASRLAPPPAPYPGWHRFTVTEPAKLLEDLRSNTDYQVVVRARCPEFGWTDYSDTLTFRTRTDCRPPQELVATEIYETSTRTQWTPANGNAVGYQVALESVLPLPPLVPQQEAASGGLGIIRTGGGNALIDLSGLPTPGAILPVAIYRDSLLTPDLSGVFTGLRPRTSYRFRVRSRCDNFGWTDYSDWFVFRTDECARPRDIVEEARDRSTMQISWTASYGVNDYEFKYQLADTPGADWLTIHTPDTVVLLTDLLANQIYDYRVAERCQGSATLRTAPQDSFLMRRPSLDKGFYACGLDTEVDLSNQVPLASLLAGDTIIAFDFPVIITRASGGGGTFSGQGEVRLPYFNQAKFTFGFDRIFVNDDYRMVGGYLQATGFGVEVLPPWADSLLADVLELLELADGILAAEQEETLAELLALGESALVPEALLATIQQVQDCFAQATTPADVESCNEQLDLLLVAIDSFLAERKNGDFQVVFTAAANQRYGFDAQGTQEPATWYQQETLAGASYPIAYKSAMVDVPETVQATVLAPGTLDSVKFTQLTDTPLPIVAAGQTAEITFVGQDRPAYFLTAEQLTADSVPNYLAGLLQVVTYEALPLNVVLVPLSASAATGIDPAAVEADLREIYQQAVVDPQVTLAPVFTPADFEPPLQAVASGLLSNYTQQMRQVQGAYAAAGLVAEDTYYLFLTDDYEPTERAGFMPRGRPFGYIYRGNAGTGTDLSRTIAHEIGHGAFVLEHTFEAFPDDLPSGSTGNLMDYGTGTHLYKWQWDLIHNPVPRPLLEGDDEGEMLAGLLFDDFSDTGFALGDQPGTNYCYFTPGGALISFVEGATELTNAKFAAGQGVFTAGSLNSFTYGGTDYIGTYKKGNSLLAVQDSFVYYYERSRFESLPAGGRRSSDLAAYPEAFLPAAAYEVATSGCPVLFRQYNETCLEEYFTWQATSDHQYQDVLAAEIAIPPHADQVPYSDPIYALLQDGPGKEVYEYAVATGYETNQTTCASLRAIAEVMNELGDILLDDYTQQAWSRQTTIHQYFYDNYNEWGYDLDAYLQELRRYQERLAGIKAALRAVEDQDRAVFLIALMNNNQLLTLPLDLRMDALKVLTSEAMTGDILSFIHTQNAEIASIRLIQTVPRNQAAAREFLAALKANGLLPLLDGRYDDLGWPYNDGNYFKFVSAIMDLLKVAYPVTEDEAFLEELAIGNRIYHWGRTDLNCNGRAITCALDYTSTWVGEELAFTFSDVSATTTWHGNASVCACNNGIPEQIALDPYAWVLIYSSKEERFGETVFLARGEKKVIPAFLLHFLTQEEVNASTRLLINTGIDVAFMAIGIGELSAASRVIRTIALVDIVVQAGDIAVNLAEETIVGIYGQAGREFIQAYRNVSMVVGLVTLSSSVSSGRLRQLFEEDARRVVDFVEENAASLRHSNQLGESATQELEEYATEIKRLIDFAEDALYLLIKEKYLAAGAADDLASFLTGRTVSIFRAKSIAGERVTDELADMLVSMGEESATILGRFALWETDFIDDFIDDIPYIESFLRNGGDLVGLEGRVGAWEIVKRAGLEDAIRINPDDLRTIADYQTASARTADDIISEIESSAITASGSSRSWIDIVPSNGGITIGQVGNYIQKERGEVFYRTISQDHYDELLSTGRIPSTTETSTSPTQAFSEDYDGVIVKFYVNHGTIDQFITIGRTDGDPLVVAQFGEMPLAKSGWTYNFVRFKKEGGNTNPQVNIQMGRGPGVQKFNDNLIAFEKIVR